jgi:hypothetical protein
MILQSLPVDDGFEFGGKGNSFWSGISSNYFYDYHLLDVCPLPAHLKSPCRSSIRQLQLQRPMTAQDPGWTGILSSISDGQSHDTWDWRGFRQYVGVIVT